MLKKLLFFSLIVALPSSNNCKISYCSAGPLPPSSVTENFCLSCDKGNSCCANPTGGKCNRKTDWTDADCTARNANGPNLDKVKASADKTSCIVPPASTTLVA